MLRFYKKLEQNFLNLSGLTKFLIYSVSEIILLVVGVVIALQVNTWGQQRNDRELEKYYLQALQEQVEKDIIDIEEVIEYDDGILDAINNLLTLAKENKSISDEAAMSYWVALFISTGTNPNTIVFEDMKSSGRMYLISSPELRFQIQEYYDYTLEAHSDNAANTQLIYRWFNDYFVSGGADINSLYSSISSTIVEVDSFEPSIFIDENKEDIIDRLTARYTLTELNLGRHYNSLELAKELTEELSLHFNR